MVVSVGQNRHSLLLEQNRFFPSCGILINEQNYVHGNQFDPCMPYKRNGGGTIVNRIMSLLVNLEQISPNTTGLRLEGKKIENM